MRTQKLNPRINTNGSGEHRIVNLSRRYGAKTEATDFAHTYQTRRAKVFCFDGHCVSYTSFERLRRPLSPQGESLELQTRQFSPHFKGESLRSLAKPVRLPLEGKLPEGVMRCSLRQQALNKRLRALHICSQHFIFWI